MSDEKCTCERDADGFVTKDGLNEECPELIATRKRFGG